MSDSLRERIKKLREEVENGLYTALAERALAIIDELVRENEKLQRHVSDYRGLYERCGMQQQDLIKSMGRRIEEVWRPLVEAARYIHDEWLSDDDPEWIVRNEFGNHIDRAERALEKRDE